MYIWLEMSTAEVKGILPVLSETAISPKKNRKKKNKTDRLTIKKQNRKNNLLQKGPSSSHQTIMYSVSITSVNKSLVLIVAILILSRTIWFSISKDLHKNIDRLNFESHVIMNGSDRFAHIQKLATFINDSKKSKFKF